MKINFNATFPEIKAQIERASTVSQGSSQDFEKVIGEITGSIKKSEQIKLDMPHAGNARLDQSKASYNFAKLNFVMPPVQIKAAPVEQASLFDESVKIPSVNLGIPAEKTAVTSPPIKNAFAGLSQPERKDKVQSLVERAAEKHGIDPALSLAVASVESSFNPAAVSQDGHFSKGLMQLLDGTGKEYLEDGENYKPFDPEQNVTLGVSYLRRLHDLFTSQETLRNNLTTVPAANSTSLEKIAVAAYNAGEGRVAWAQDQAKRSGKNPAVFDDIAAFLPEITQQYVEKVINRRDIYGEKFKG